MISLYKVLTIKQVVRLFPQKELGVVTGILSMLNWSGRLDFHKNEGLVKVILQAKPDFSVIKAFGCCWTSMMESLFTQSVTSLL